MEVARQLQLRQPRRLLRGDRLRRGEPAVGGHAARRRRRHGAGRAPDGRAAAIACSRRRVRVKGVGDLLVRFARCCHPIPGDPIQGFITRGKGVTVHLRSCPTVLNEREVSRLIEVEWEAAPAQTYPIAIRVEAYDRTGLLSDITQVVGGEGQHPRRRRVGRDRSHRGRARPPQVASVSQLARVLSRIEQLKDVFRCPRDPAG